MVEDKVGLDRIFEKEETKETDQTDLVDDRAVPNLSNPNPIHSELRSNDLLQALRVGLKFTFIANIS